MKEQGENKNLHTKTNKIVVFLLEFVDFLKDFSVFSVAIGLVIGTAVTYLVGSITSNLISPLIQLILPGRGFENWRLEVNNVVFDFGAVFDAIINLLVVVFVIFFILKLISKVSFKSLKKD